MRACRPPRSTIRDGHSSIRHTSSRRSRTCCGRPRPEPHLRSRLSDDARNLGTESPRTEQPWNAPHEEFDMSSVTGRLIKGSMWLSLSRAIVNALATLSTLVLAWYLAP